MPGPLQILIILMPRLLGTLSANGPTLLKVTKPSPALLVQTSSQGTSLSPNIPQSMGFFPRNLHKHISPQYPSEIFPHTAFPALQNAPPCHPPGTPRFLPAVPILGPIIFTLGMRGVPYSSSGLSTGQPAHTSRLETILPALHTPKLEFALSTCVDRLLRQVLAGPLFPPQGPFSALGSHTCQGSPKFPPQREGHTFPPWDLSRLPSHPESPHSRLSVLPVQTLRNAPGPRLPDFPPVLRTAARTGSCPRRVPGAPNAPPSPTRSPWDATSNPHLAGDPGGSAPAPFELGSLPYRTLPTLRSSPGFPSQEPGGRSANSHSSSQSRSQPARDPCAPPLRRPLPVPPAPAPPPTQSHPGGPGPPLDGPSLRLRAGLGPLPPPPPRPSRRPLLQDGGGGGGG